MRKSPVRWLVCVIWDGAVLRRTLVDVSACRVASVRATASGSIRAMAVSPIRPSMGRPESMCNTTPARLVGSNSNPAAKCDDGCITSGAPKLATTASGTARFARPWSGSAWPPGSCGGVRSVHALASQAFPGQALSHDAKSPGSDAAGRDNRLPWGADGFSPRILEPQRLIRLDRARGVGDGALEIGPARPGDRAVLLRIASDDPRHGPG